MEQQQNHTRKQVLRPTNEGLSGQPGSSAEEHAAAVYQRVLLGRRVDQTDPRKKYTE
jgi:hypothetical protein